MNPMKGIPVGVGLLAAAVGAASLAAQQTPTVAAPPAPAIELPVNELTSYKGEEFLLIGNAVRGAGEPVIAINPRNPNNIIVGAMANDHYVEGAPLGTGQQRITIEARVKYRNTPRASITIYAISHDRGRTWTYMEDPFRDYFKMNGTADAFVGAGRDGRLFIGAMNFFPMNASPQMLELEREGGGAPGLLFGATDMTWSDDEGKTWAHPPIHVMGQATHPMEYGPGVKPVFLGKTPYDRPYLIADLSTGTIYVPGNGTAGEPPHRTTFIRASRDNGQTWGLIYTFDSPEYPQGGSSARPGAAHGVLGVAYIASAVPASATAGKCPCLVFGASRDEGKTFDRHVVQSGVPTPQGFGGFGNPSLAADPSRPGRFAVMTTAPGEMTVYVTEDYGKTWAGPIKAGGTPGTNLTKADMGYSPRGDLALMWLAVNPGDQSYTAWSAASRDGGKTFGKSLQVSRSPSPPRSSNKNRGNHWDGDDLSSLAVDHDYVHIVWADGRAGFLGSWYARVPLAAY
jgi:hypothetical protein